MSGKRINWTPEMDVLLGTVPDIKVANIIGCSISPVRRRRIELGVPSYQSVTKIKWTSNIISLLGTLPDKKLASKIGCSSTAIVRKRRELDIPPYSLVFTPEQESLIGTMSDRKVADIVGCGKNAVRNRRIRLGIPAYNKKVANRINWSGWDELLGTMPDAELARKIGCSVGAVAHRRRVVMGIPNYMNRLFVCEDCGATENKSYSNLCTRCYYIRRLYGITSKTYNEMLARQEGKCGICRVPPDANSYFFIDHDHDTGEVRGLLCSNCNSLIGMANENISVLETAIKYLEQK